MSFHSGPAQWRLPIGFQAVFALCLFLQCMVLPDSPRWLIAHGRVEEGARVIAMLEDRDSIDHPDVVRVQKDIEHSLSIESAGGASFHLLIDKAWAENKVWTRSLQIQRALRGRSTGEFPADLLVHRRQCYAAVHRVRFITEILISTS